MHTHVYVLVHMHTLVETTEQNLEQLRYHRTAAEKDYYMCNLVHIPCLATKTVHANQAPV